MVLGKGFRPFLRHSPKIVRLAVRTVCQYHSLVNYAVVQLRRKRTLLHWSNIPYLHTCTTISNFYRASAYVTRDIDIANLSVCPSVRPSVRLSVTLRYQMKTA